MSYTQSIPNYDRNNPELIRAIRILADILYYANPNHELPTREIEEQASEFDVPLHQLRKAKDILRVQANKHSNKSKDGGGGGGDGGGGGHWVWSLPADYEPKRVEGGLLQQEEPAPDVERHSYMTQTPCAGCGNFITFLQEVNSTTRKENDGRIEYGYCQACQDKEETRKRENLHRELIGTKHTLKTIKAYDPNDPQAGPLQRRVDYLSNRLGLPVPTTTTTSNLGTAV